MCSVAASLATAKFNELRLKRNLKISKDIRVTSEIISNLFNMKLATFDARVFVIPEIEEVVNYFIWRQKDATRNSISMAAQSLFSYKQLHGKSCNQMQDMMMVDKSINWNSYPIGFKRGRSVKKMGNYYRRLKNSKSPVEILLPAQMGEYPSDQYEIYERNSWEIIEPPIFSRDRNFILDLIKKSEM